MLEKLSNPDVWEEYFEYKTAGKLLSKRDEEYLRCFIDDRRYLNVTARLSSEANPFGIPVRKEINKLGTEKKRVVYSFGEDENMVLKLLSYLLYKYDYAFCDNCYAFRRSIGPRRAFSDIAKRHNNTLYGFKSDISNYFNSLNVDILCKLLGEIITDDEELLNLLVALLKDNRAIKDGEIIYEQRGAMAGVPIAPFLANVYLSKMDKYFYDRGVIYARYSDDIIIFDTLDKIDEHIAEFHRFINEYQLVTNPSKEERFAPSEAWSFLGFQYKDGVIDISPAAVKKIMGKIRRKARSIRRWMLNKELDPKYALRAFNKRFNRKFYSGELGSELCWSRWYFPIINTTDSLKAIDQYMQQYERYIVTGKQNKANFDKAPYELLKENGYRPLVTEYYKEKERE